MGNIKKWATGAIGNNHPDHSDRDNPNSAGLDSSGFPGIEAYIEEDEVTASTDNRPLKNLVENDGIISQNVSDIASEVDNGIFKDKYNAFDIEIQSQDVYKDPETNEDFLVNPIRINSGSAIINGQVTRIGNQKLVYFYRNDDSNSILFPSDDKSSSYKIEIYDDDYFSDKTTRTFGSYTPVYNTITDDLPENFENYEINIIQRDTKDSSKENVTIFSLYRDWEDIVPFKPHSAAKNDEVITFNSDLNFGQDSEGYWLNCGDAKNTKVTDVEIKKDIPIKNKAIFSTEFVADGSGYSKSIVTDGLFFKNITWSATEYIDSKADIQDLYYNENGYLYFIQRSTTNAGKRLFRLPNSSSQLESQNIGTPDGSVNLKLKAINNYLFVLGTKGFVTILDMSKPFSEAQSIVELRNFYIPSNKLTTEDIVDITIWDGKIWIAGETNLWYTDYATFNPNISTFTAVNVSDYVLNVSGNAVISHINKILPVVGNYRATTTLGSKTINLLKNPSFEYGGVGNIPNDWTFTENASGSIFRIAADEKNIGNYSSFIRKNENSTYCALSQNIAAASSSYSLSAYLKSNIATTDKAVLSIYELDESGVVLNSTFTEITPTTTFERYSHSHEISNTATKYIKAEVMSKIVANTTEGLYVDNVQLEEGQVSNYVESFNYLFIGFKKVDTNVSDQPFALIDADDPYHIKYTQGKYGNISSVNDAISDENNKIVFVDDRNMNTLVILNNKDEYNGFTITSLIDHSNDTYNTIKKFETIKKIGPKYYFGGIVDNRVIRIESTNPDTTEVSHSIKIEDVDSKFGESFLTLMDGYTFIKASSIRNASIQFNRIAPCYDSNNSITSSGRYIPDADYAFKIIYDDDVDNAEIIIVKAPSNNKAPWTIDGIRSSLSSKITPTILPEVTLLVTENDILDDAYGEWYSISNSLTVKDGFYASNGTDIETFIRGNIHSIFVDNNEMYIAKDTQIFKSKFDPNLLKVKRNSSSSLIKSSKNLYVEQDWNLYDVDYSLNEYNNIINKELSFADDANNRHWINLDAGDGYTILPGSLRVKTNSETEVGFSEGIDYFVDYDTLKIIRSKGSNCLHNTSFSLKTGDLPSNWSYYKDSADIISFAKQEHFNSSFTNYVVRMARAQGYTQSILYQNVSATSISGVSTLQKGETYTFSIYVQSAIAQDVKIRLSECNDLDAASFSNLVFSENVGTTTIDNKWVRLSVSHTITSSSSTNLRVELYSQSSYQLFTCKPMLEKNNSATPYIEAQNNSSISPDSHVWVDYTRIKTLTPTIDYTFDTNSRKVILTNTPNENSTYYFNYKYEKIFNAYCFEDEGNFSKPSTEIIDYTENDDYFLYELEGKIWAINQNFAILSLDVDNPIKVSYKYHYPRIDQIKIRNNPDKYGNYLYLVHGSYNKNNPYRPVDVGLTKDRYVYNTSLSDIKDLTDLKYFNNIDNEILYEINVQNNDYSKNDIYDRRIYVDAKDHKNYNISLFPETIAYFPFLKDFNSTNGLEPLNALTKSKIIPIIKNYNIVQNSEVGAYHSNYQYVLRNNSNMITPQASYSIYVDPINGSDINGDGSSIGGALKTIKKALSFLTQVRNNIIITSNCVISENIEIDLPYEVKIFASTYCYWKGGLQNNSSLSIQGIWFQNTNVYCYDTLNLFFCTFENSSINCVYPQEVSVYNSEFKNCHNPILRVKDIIFPTPFTHPYQKFAKRDDGIANPDNPTTATSNRESIAPGDSFYDSLDTTQPTGSYKFFGTLIYGSTDSIIKYDPNPDWDSSFVFDYCTIAHNKKIIETEKYNLSITFSNTVLYKNYVLKDDKKLLVSSNSDITLNNCFIDFSSTDSATKFNDLSGVLAKRESCVGGTDTSEPGFLGESEGIYDYHLKSVAKGSSIDSPCLDIGDARDIGVYDESREQQDKGFPQKLRTYVAYFGEGIVYPIQLNSEKITISLSFKPVVSVGSPAIVLDTRSSPNDEDYFVLAYNNNDDSSVSLTQDDTASTNPYKFRVIMANKEKSYAVVSPIEMTTDEEFQVWHNISFTVNYEEITNTKSGFVTKDKKQNIITLYHNDTVTIESFIKYDLNRFIDGEIIPGRGEDKSNLWNFNNICKFITIGSDYTDSYRMVGYFTEFRVDNRFIDRKQIDMWKSKEVPFSDPMSYVNQTPITRSLNPKTLSEYWSLKSKSEFGAKGTPLNSNTSKEIIYENGELVWAITGASDNLYANGNFINVSGAAVVATGIITYPITIANVIRLQTAGSNNIYDNAGFDLSLTGTFTSQAALITRLNQAFPSQTSISYSFTSTGLLKFYTKDWKATSLTVTINSADYAKLKFPVAVNTANSNPNGYTVSGVLTTNSNRVWTGYDSDKTLFGENLMHISKDTSLISDDIVKVYRNVSLGAGDYAFSCYIYSNENLDDTNVAMYYNGNIIPFDKIEKYYGNCWKCVNTISPTTSMATTVGVTIQQSGLYSVAGIQLEYGKVAKPFAVITKPDNGKIVIPKNVINKKSGVIAFRFKPLFDYYETTDKYILETVGVDGSDLVEQQGYKIIYKYDTVKKTGVISYSINSSESSKCEFEITERFFDQWHTCIINYDYNINRFVLWYDFYKEIVDESLTSYDLSNLYIGRGVEGLSRIDAEKTTDILVKDIILTNYPITDNESQNWINAYEFYNESLLINTIDQYKNQVETYISNTSDFVSVANNLLTEVATLPATISRLDANTAELRGDVDVLQDAVSENTAAIEGITSSGGAITTINNTVSNIENIINMMQDGGSGSWDNDKPNLYDIKNDLNVANNGLSVEVTNRISADTAIRNDFASTSAVSSGGSLVGINKGTMFTASTIEAALKELAGPGRTVETVYGLQQSINSIINNSSSNDSVLSYMQDGGDGSWTEARAANEGYNIVSLKTNVGLINSSITAIQNNHALLATNTTSEVTRLDSKIDAVYTDYASIENGKGSSLIGFYNGTQFESSTVEAALKELAGPSRNSSMNISDIYLRHDNVVTTVNGLDSTVSSLSAAIGNIPKIIDGVDGSTWTSPETVNLVAHNTAINTLNTSFAELSNTVDTHTTALDGAVNRISTVETGLATEVTTRQNAINLFKSSDAGKGASLIGISDISDNFTANNVEEVLSELAEKIAALAGALSWQASVNTHNDLPVTGNKAGDARTVKTDTDGHQSQYVCIAVTGGINDQWIKIADIDWGNASAISYDNTNSGLTAQDVNAALDEIVERTSNPAKFEIELAQTDWNAGVATITHDLGTDNVSVMVYDLDSGMMIGLDEIIRLNKNQIEIHATQAINASITIFAVVDRMTVIIDDADWAVSGSEYYYDIVHNFNKKAIMVSAFDTVTGDRVGLGNVEAIDETTTRIHASSRAKLNVYLAKNIQNTQAKDIRAWKSENGMFVSTIPDMTGFDAVYAFFEITTGKTVEIDMVTITNGTLKLTKTTNNPIRMIIIQ